MKDDKEIHIDRVQGIDNIKLFTYIGFDLNKEDILKDGYFDSVEELQDGDVVFVFNNIDGYMLPVVGVELISTISGYNVKEF